MKVLINNVIVYEGNSISSIDEAFKYAKEFQGDELEIRLSKGIYRCMEAINIPQDSAFKVITISGEEREKTIISGSFLIDNSWQVYKDNIYMCHVGTHLPIDMLYVNDKLYHMARYPKYNENIRILQGYAKDCISEERIKKWSNPVDGYFHAIHKHRWGDFHYEIQGKDSEGRLILKGGTQNNRRLGLHDEHRYVEHIFEELSANGEWFYNKKEGTLFVIFEEEVDLSCVKVEAVVNESLFKVVGTSEKMLKNVVFRNLTFTHTKRTFMKVEEPLLRSDWCIYRGGAIYFKNAQNCVIENCDLINLGSNAICVDGNNRNIKIKSSKISEVAGNGICFIGDTDSVRSPLFEYAQRQHIDEIDLEAGPKSDDYPKECEVIDCLITRTGRVEKQTAAVQVSMASRIRIANCSIYDLPRAAINFSEGNFGGHIIENCDIFDTVLETGDHGSFNSWGRDRYWELEGICSNELGATNLPFLDVVETNIIRNNRIRCDFGWDIDLDDGSSNYDIYNNLCLNGGIKLREGFRRKVYNNIIVNNGLHAHVWYENSGDCIYNNIMFSKYEPIQMKVEWGDRINHNVLHSDTEDIIPKPATLLMKDSKKDEESILCNCMFQDIKKGNYTVCNKKVLENGFENFSMDCFGVISDRLKKEVKIPIYPEIKRLNHTDGNEEEYFYFQKAIYKNISSMEEASAYGVGSKDGTIYEGVIVVELPNFLQLFSKGLRSRDVILKINNIEIRSLEDLRKYLRCLETCEGIQFTILRNQIEMTL